MKKMTSALDFLHHCSDYRSRVRTHNESIVRSAFSMANPSAPWNFPLPLGMSPLGHPADPQHSPSISSTIGERKQRTLRLSINARERRRMHDLNDALDELRSVVSEQISESFSCRWLEFLLDSLRPFAVGAEIEQNLNSLSRSVSRSRTGKRRRIFSFVSAKNFILLQAQAIDELKRCVLRASLIGATPAAATNLLATANLAVPTPNNNNNSDQQMTDD